MNCFLKQQLCRKHNIKRQFLGKCAGKKATFGDITKYGAVGGLSTTTHPTTTISIPFENVDYDPDTAAVRENMAMFLESQETNSDEFGFSNYPVEMNTTREAITRDNFPSAVDLWNDYASDNACVICPKGGNWDYDTLEHHYDTYHDIVLQDDLTYEDWKEAEERHRTDPWSFSDAPSDDEKDIINKRNSENSSNERYSSRKSVKSSGNSSDSSTSGNSSE